MAKQTITEIYNSLPVFCQTKLDKLASKLASKYSQEKPKVKPKSSKKPVATKRPKVEIAEEEETKAKLKSKRIRAKKEPIFIGKRENMFVKMSDFKSHKEDTKIDKKLSQFKPVPRGGRKVEKVTLECCCCGTTVDVVESLVPPEPQYWSCEECIRNGVEPEDDIGAEDE